MMQGRALVALPLLFAAAALADAPPHQQWARAAVAALPVFHEDTDAPGKADELAAIADAVAAASKSAPQPPQAWASLMLSVAHAESGLSSRIIAGNCKKHECDRGRARGIGQVWRNVNNAADWDRANGDVVVQVHMLDEQLRRAYWQCARSGVPWVPATINAFAGVRCGATWPGLDKRVATFNRLTHVSAKPGSKS